MLAAQRLATNSAVQKFQEFTAGSMFSCMASVWETSVLALISQSGRFGWRQISQSFLIFFFVFIKDISTGCIEFLLGTSPARLWDFIGGKILQIKITVLLSKRDCSGMRWHCWSIGEEAWHSLCLSGGFLGKLDRRHWISVNGKWHWSVT